MDKPEQRDMFELCAMVNRMFRANCLDPGQLGVAIYSPSGEACGSLTGAIHAQGFDPQIELAPPSDTAFYRAKVMGVDFEIRQGVVGSDEVLIDALRTICENECNSRNTRAIAFNALTEHHAMICARADYHENAPIVTPCEKPKP